MWSIVGLQMNPCRNCPPTPSTCGWRGFVARLALAVALCQRKLNSNSSLATGMNFCLHLPRVWRSMALGLTLPHANLCGQGLCPNLFWYSFKCHVCTCISFLNPKLTSYLGALQAEFQQQLVHIKEATRAKEDTIAGGWYTEDRMEKELHYSKFLGFVMIIHQITCMHACSHFVCDFFFCVDSTNHHRSYMSFCSHA